jgi:hypothetical protein
MVESKTSAVAAFLGVLTVLEEFQFHCCVDVTILGTKTVFSCPFSGEDANTGEIAAIFRSPVKNFRSAAIND